MGRPSIAIAKALQFELTLRQIGVTGEWSTTRETASGTTDCGQRWSGGAQWSDIDRGRVLRKKTTKPGQVAVHDANADLLVAECLALAPTEMRIGPILMNETTGLPDRYSNFDQMWRAVARKAGVPDGVWSRDSRAGGITGGTPTGVDLETMRCDAKPSADRHHRDLQRRNLGQDAGVAAAVRIAAGKKPKP